MLKRYKNIQDMLDDIEQDRINHPIKDFFLTIQCKLELFFWDKPKYLINTVKWFIQRGKRGYSERDLWDLDWYLAEMIPNALRDLRESQHCCPGWKEQEDFVIAQKRWDTIIEDIIYIFEKSDEVWNLTKEEKKRYDKGWRLFKKHFSDLGD